MSYRKSGDCPKSEDFVRAFLGEVGDGAGPEFLEHVGRCPICRPRMQVLAQVKTKLEARVDMVPEAGLTREETRRLRRAAVEQLRLMRPSTHRLSLRALQLAAAAVVVLALGYLYLNNSLYSRFAMRGSANHELRLLGPGPHLRSGPADFSWSDVPGRDDFRFVLVDDELNTIYEVETEATSVRLPESVRGKLARGGTYLWTVVAVDDNSRDLATASRVFEVE
jgi:hypothetical protein